jgi:hypothetical protein
MPVNLRFASGRAFRLGSVRDTKTCPQRRQLSSQAVAGCGRRLHRGPLSTGLDIGGGTCSNCGRWGRRPWHLQRAGTRSAATRRIRLSACCCYRETPALLDPACKGRSPTNVRANRRAVAGSAEQGGIPRIGDVDHTFAGKLIARKHRPHDASSELFERFLVRRRDQE